MVPAQFEEMVKVKIRRSKVKVKSKRSMTFYNMKNNCEKMTKNLWKNVWYMWIFVVFAYKRIYQFLKWKKKHFYVKNIFLRIFCKEYLPLQKKQKKSYLRLEIITHWLIIHISDKGSHRNSFRSFKSLGQGRLNVLSKPLIW